MPILRFHPKPTKSQTPGWDPRLRLQYPQVILTYRLKFENHYLKTVIPQHLVSPSYFQALAYEEEMRFKKV